MPLTCKSWPIPAVIAIPRQPPIITRNVGIAIFEPEVFALTTPVRANPRIVKIIMLIATEPVVGAKAPRNGMSPPAVKAHAEAIAA